MSDLPENVVRLGVITHLDLDPDLVLRAAVGELPGGVVVIGYDADGEEYFASSISDGPAVLWLLERFRDKLLRQPEEWDGVTHPKKGA